MVIYATDRYIVYVFGTYVAKDNDATILRHILEKEKDAANGKLDEISLEGDLVILDRGFRNVAVELREKYKLCPKLPTCVPPSQKALICIETKLFKICNKVSVDD
jgi:hypothetical protein